MLLKRVLTSVVLIMQSTAAEWLKGIYIFLYLFTSQTSRYKIYLFQATIFTFI